MGSGIPLLTPTVQAGQDSDGGGVYQGDCVRCKQWMCGGFGTRRPSSLEAFCKDLEGAAQLFIIKLACK